MPVVTNLMPADGATAVTRRPLFAADIAHPRKKRMDVVFEIDNDGGWTTLKTFTGVGDGRYTVKAPKLAGFASEYRWRVRVSSGDNTGVAKAVFTTEPKAHYLGIAYCMGVSWTAQSVTGKGRFRLAYEYHPYKWKELKNDHYVMTREYDRDQGWIEKGYTVAEKIRYRSGAITARLLGPSAVVCMERPGYAPHRISLRLLGGAAGDGPVKSDVDLLHERPA